MIDASNVRIALIGLQDHETPLAGAISQFTLQRLPMDLCTLAKEASQRVRGGKSEEPNLVLVGQPPEWITTDELGQTLRMVYQHAIIYNLVWDRKKFNRRIALKNGFTDAFLLPLETKALRRSIQDILRKLTQGGILSYRPIKLKDLRPGSNVPFNLALFLPMNSKYVPFINKGDLLTMDRFERMLEHNMNTVFVNTDEMPDFYHYAGQMSLTERRHILEDRFRVAMSDFLRGGEIPLIRDAEAFFTECCDAVHQCILDFPEERMSDQIIAPMCDVEDHYNHALNTATYAALFSMILGIGDPSEMAVAGLLHDLGEIDLPFEVTVISKEDLTGEDLEKYRKHPSLSMDLVRELNLPIGDGMKYAIEQHQEEWDGGGYPNAYRGDLIKPQALLLSLADRFDYLSRHKIGEPARSPAELLARVGSELLHSPKEPIPRELVREVLRAIKL